MNETKRPLVLVAVMLAMFMAAVEATIIATAMPRIVADLGGFALFSWVFSAYLLMQVVTIPLYGKLADIYGRKLIFSIGIILFLIGSILCGFSWSMEMLILSRFIQGIGAGAVQPIATTIVGDMYTKEERAKIQGYLSSIWGISAILGPLLGAFFVEYVNWSWVFWINVPFGIFSVLIVCLFLNEKIEQKQQKLDYGGALLLFVTMTTMMFVFLQLDGDSFLTWVQLLFIFVCSIIGLIWFIYHEKKTLAPMVNFTLWKRREILYANLASLTTGAMLLTVSTFLPTYVQAILEQSPLIAGLTLTAMSIGWPISAMIAGKMILKVGFRITALIGGGGLFVGAICYLTLSSIAYPLWAALGSFFIGVGMGFSTTTFIVSIQSTVDWKSRGEATAMNMFMRQLGGVIGVTLLGGLLNRYLRTYFQNVDDKVTFEPTIDEVNRILDETERVALTNNEQLLLQEGLSGGLSYIFIALLVLAVVTFFLILQLPKDEKSKEAGK
ncbi:MDR family MFS transporter [Halalkalibacter hemicellulosilyticus]|uniref:Drug resistance transporter n=1 Tax=Halalkalibacter hemicellulosilyticusJCM 9152 TaxID=1236971 RepID=W4QJC6_9BACI|nr:MDR family MFS transporter [Halalkalibacter hemicellulosilyticus]GAE32225.1 drug resistance transporter [Halalkalibacter hemicellulosilyticusJCM 9152]